MTSGFSVKSPSGNAGFCPGALLTAVDEVDELDQAADQLGGAAVGPPVLRVDQVEHRRRLLVEELRELLDARDRRVEDVEHRLERAHVLVELAQDALEEVADQRSQVDLHLDELDREGLGVRERFDADSRCRR